MAVKMQTTWKIAGLVLLGLTAFLLTNYLMKRSEPRLSAPGENGFANARKRETWTKSVPADEGFQVPQKQAPLDRHSVSQSSLHCSVMEVTQDTIKVKAGATYQTRRPQTKCVWTICVFQPSDGKQTVFEKSYPEKIVEVVADREHALTLDERIDLSVPLNPGQYRVEVQLQRKTSRDKGFITQGRCSKIVDIN